MNGRLYLISKSPQDPGEIRSSIQFHSLFEWRKGETEEQLIRFTVQPSSGEQPASCNQNREGSRPEHPPWSSDTQSAKLASWQPEVEIGPPIVPPPLVKDAGWASEMPLPREDVPQLPE
ncbi:hypothetical protein SKAU_G00209730 [Synaphobranchus kaupii]|uniref:Uncharacterized protein n=1 Tax=Synaphobranchus kaupii TaxID=118154 RepID=A0A9Q1F962_SYNKA|nr:hypothetical protein SKAU_G00209730 [Synaphobranchus kaupii]